MVRTFEHEGFTSANGNLAADRVVLALSQTLSCPTGQWLLGNHHEGACEAPMNSPNPDVPGTFNHHIIDRVFIDDGVRWIIDYKTGIDDHLMCEAQLQTKALSYQSQLERYADLFKGDAITTRTAIFFPARGTLVVVPISNEEV